MTTVSAKIAEVKESVKVSVNNGGATVKSSGAKEVLQVVTNDYEVLKNKPQINDVTLSGNKSFEDLGLESITNSELEDMLKI